MPAASSALRICRAPSSRSPASEASIASTATIDFAAGDARFDDLTLKLNPLQLTGNLLAQDFL